MPASAQSMIPSILPATASRTPPMSRVRRASCRRLPRDRCLSARLPPALACDLDVIAAWVVGVDQHGDGRSRRIALGVRATKPLALEVMCGAGRRIAPLSLHEPVVAIRRRKTWRPGGRIRRSARARLHPLVQDVRDGGRHARARAPQLADLLLAQDALYHAERDKAEDDDEEDREAAAATH